MNPHIVPFDVLSETQLEGAASILMHALAHAPSAWHDRAAAQKEVASFVGNDQRLAFAALDGEIVVGWIGAVLHSQFTWELHPLVVEPELQRHGYGGLLVDYLDSAAADAGVSTLWLGTDDDFGGTNLFGVDLYPEVLENLLRLRPKTSHPYTFYEAHGFSVVGVVPDANGFGKHDIMMAKRVGKSPNRQ
ncbi:MAG: GNAT family N-acetyltransferase [Rhodospirillales bacterium]|nr:GNAT family N-acetyltransferase [Rhodospirillales bacterium]